jgi:type I site-specific restriction endonuclease
MNKKDLTEADIGTKFITPAIVGPGGAGWDVMTQVLEERTFTKGRVIVRGKVVTRGEAKKADYIRRGIEDGFLAPYKVVRIGLDKDLDGWRPEKGKVDKYGQEIEDREYNDLDFDLKLILEKRTALVAAKITEFLKATNRFAKTINFCENIDHAERMRQALVNANPDLAAANKRYVMRITGDNDEGKAQLDNFIDPESTYPVIATTSKLMTTGVDAQTCQQLHEERHVDAPGHQQDQRHRLQRLR